MIRLIKRYNQIDKFKLLLINNQKGNRYGESVISSHDKVQMKCHSLEKLYDIKDTSNYKNCNVIFIEEGQFFEDLLDFCLEAADKDNKIVYVAGLDGDFQRKEFGQMCQLVPHAEEITKLKALCSLCGDGSEAHFTKRIVDDKNVELIGSKESYIPVCRKHFNE